MSSYLNYSRPFGENKLNTAFCLNHACVQKSCTCLTGFKEKQPFRVEFKDEPKKKVAERAKKKNSCHNCGSTDQYANNCLKAKKKIYAIEKVPEEEIPTEDSESGSMGDAIGEQSDDDQDPREEFQVE
ncbi:hypothetical protein O181_080441 [Austropuccinia psidii MF-1]|uniref:Uncharacterized protein n=1 Tax=Austropuccinia psidii MF-1 TaxID=1389203 RepID=A0A9Q3FNS4_9BASI|nr:hypothetical protein [Austropuccinia psidii MF-1]